MSAEILRQASLPNESASAELNGSGGLHEAAVALQRSKSITLNDWLIATQGVSAGGRPSDMV